MSHPCPVCNSPLPVLGPCTVCGPKTAAKPTGAPSWDDDELGGGLEFSRGGAETHSGGPSAYAGGGMSLGDDDDAFADPLPAGGLELDVPVSHSARSARSIPAATEAPASLRPGNPPSASLRVSPHVASISPRSASGAQPKTSEAPLAASPPKAPDPPDPARQIARYPDAPEKIWQAPRYAVNVVLRQLELRQDLESLRNRRSPDVGLYERALSTYDRKTFTVGLAILVVGVVLATVLFCLPVILRFASAPSDYR